MFRLTVKDFKIEAIRGSGKGGQKKQKTSSAIRITHIETGLSQFCQDHREQHRNKAQAFLKLANSPAFRVWCERKLLMQEEGAAIEKWVEEQMKEENLIVEYIE